jgi:hypothetical protein
VDESVIGSAKVLPPEEFRLNWWQNFFYALGPRAPLRRNRRSWFLG